MVCRGPHEGGRGRREEGGLRLHWRNGMFLICILANLKSNTVDLIATLEYKFIDKSQKYMFLL